MTNRQNRRPPEGTITKSVTMTAALAARIAAEAERAGHYNFSTVCVQAITEHLDRQESEGEAA